METMTEQCEISFSRPADDALLVQLTGNWKSASGLPPVSEVQKQIESIHHTRRITFNTEKLTGWDSGLLTFLIKVIEYCSNNNINLEEEGLTPGVRRLLALAAAVPEKKDARTEAVREPYLVLVGKSTINLYRSAGEMIAFIGEAFLAFITLLRGKARYRRSDLFLLIQDCSAQALPIVSLISVLVGMILAFVGAIQLEMFGAQIYVANLVGIGMAREMGAMMTGIIMAGRTGASFAASLGTMQVNEEIDALKTMGFSPMEFLVLPRMLALVFMMPLLCLYADFMGIIGGMIVGVGTLDLTFMQYYKQTQMAIKLTDFSVGIFKGGVFGVLVAIAGCLRGIQSGRSASSVGDAATSAVVTGIVFIIVFDSMLTIIFNAIGI
jgi:phospholipid/cholesterol/gamma-HCH transport system permease protein